MGTSKEIEIIGARQNNLKNFNLKIPKETFTVVTGPSGSGKSSLAFDTLFAEGQRRYMESLSTYARQFMEKQEKPDIDEIKGICPTIAIEQKNHTKNSRSTVGTATELYDYLRLIFAKMGTMYCLKTGEPVKKDLVKEVVDAHVKGDRDCKLLVCFPVDFDAKSKILDRKRVLMNLVERGFTRALVVDQLKVASDVVQLDLQEQIQAKSTPLLGKATKPQKIYIVTDRIIADEENKARFADAMIQSYSEGFGRASVLVLGDGLSLASIKKYCEFPSSGGGENRYPEMSPALFSFNSPMGACEKCKGFGNLLKIDPALVIPRPELSLSQGAIEPFTKPSCKHWLKQLLLFCQQEKISLTAPWNVLKETDREKIWSGHKDFPGVDGLFEELESDRYKMQVRVFLSRYRSPRPCPSCKGHRLRAEARNVLFHGKSIGDLSAMTIEELQLWFKETPLTSVEKEMGKDIFPQIGSRLEFLLRVGLDYLSLDRLAKTLSGGEAQRIALANQLGARLTQTCYVLDEPSIGLHPKDTERLIGIMNDLVKLRNTVVVVEHDPDIIRSSEYLIDIGPESGEHGGEILFAGPFKEFTKSVKPESHTLSFLQGKDAVPVPKRRRQDRFKDTRRTVEWLEMTGCSENNLLKADLKIPLGMLTCVTGVSGSGKSSAIRKTLYPALAKIFLQENLEVGRFEKIMGFNKVKSVLMVDQEPIGRSPRSNPITFMKAYDEVREMFASTEESRRKRFHAGHFSFNVPGGRCDVCEGDGYQRIEMVFMEDMFLKCDMCEGKRFKEEVLNITYNKKNIHDVLNMTVSEARKFFGTEKRLQRALSTLEQVGLGYLRLGQASNTLSGGESQRLKIARELTQTDAVGVVYILDEPTTGLHFRDVKTLVRVLHELVERGNTVVVIEHNLDVMKSSDWIIDFGPGGGKHGGKIIAEGTPETIAKSKLSVTAGYLKTVLENSPHVGVDELFKG